MIVRAKTDDHFPQHVKQVIVLRRLYPDGNGGTKKVRAGKLAAQAAHASMMWLVERVCQGAKPGLEHLVGKMSAYPGVQYTYTGEFGLTTEERAWMTEKFTKVVVGIDTEAEMLALYQEALDNGLTARLVHDVGATEFDGQRTLTALAIGPHSASRIDPLTKGLSLL
ncbi:MAG: hypothetical protein JSS66_07585 [Armatimonadetes bacterium]|nr:hypothetical protein [Armatimonadota bacterium]